MINYGVIVGRFQVNSLHPGHLELFRQVSEKHDRVIVFIGVPRTIPTIRNPLDFETRKKMIQAEYPDFNILPLRDEKSDEFWSKKLDEAIESVSQFTGAVTLYGGRDSFAPHYFGRHKLTQLEITSPITGTEIRNKITNRVMQSADFRAGAIYAALNQFPRTLPTVDVAILHDEGDRIKLLLGKKPGEHNYRFIGGFVNPGETLESAARRETYEETNLDISSVEYIGSFPVNDWRYANDKDTKILTSFFVGWSTSRGHKAGDDINKVRWFDAFYNKSDYERVRDGFEPVPQIVEPEHMSLLEKFNEFIDRRYRHV